MSKRAYSGGHLFLALIFGLVLGFSLESTSDPLISTTNPTEKVQMTRQLDALNGRIEDQGKTIHTLTNNIAELNQQLLASKKETQEAHDAIDAAKPRYQFVQIGSKAFRLDTSTGQSCLLFSPEPNEKIPEIAFEGHPGYPVCY
jgi:cell division protein FtsB